jgi:hypothetical protein
VAAALEAAMLTTTVRLQAPSGSDTGASFQRRPRRYPSPPTGRALFERSSGCAWAPAP